MKKAPHFWWDFSDNATTVIIESDIPDHPVLARYPVVDASAEPQIEQAEKLIADLAAGRVTVKQVVEAGDPVIEAKAHPDMPEAYSFERCGIEPLPQRPMLATHTQALSEDWRTAAQAAISHLDYPTDAPMAVIAALRAVRDAHCA